MGVLKSRAFRRWLLTPVIIIAIVGLSAYYFQSSYNPYSLEDAKFECERLCNQTQSINVTTQWDDTGYCNVRFAIDGNMDGKIQIDERGRHCWESPIYVECAREFSDAYGTQFTCSSTHCDDTCPATGCDDIGAQGIVCSELTEEALCEEIGCTWDNNQCYGLIKDCPKDFDTCKKVETENGCKWQQPAAF